MAFLDDLLSNARWLDQYLGTQRDQNQGVTADEAQRSPPPPTASSQSVTDWLASMGLLGAGPQGTSPGLLRPLGNGASGVDESGFNLAYPGPTQLPPAAAPAAQQGPIPGGPSYMGNPFGGAVQVPTAGVQPETTDISAAPKRQLPVQPLPTEAPAAVNPGQVLPSPYQPNDNLFGRLQAGAQNFTTGGNPIAGILNAVQGLTTGVRTDQTGIALAQQQQSANAIFKHLVTVQKMEPTQAATVAQMLALHPELAKQYFNPPKTVEEAAVRPGTFGAPGGGINAATEFYGKKQEQESYGKDLADYAKKISSDVQAATSMKNTLDRMSRLGPQAYEGAGAPGLQYVRSFMQTFMNQDVSKIKAGEEFTALTNRLALEKLGSFGTGISNADRESIMAQFPQLVNTKEGRMQIINTLRTLADRQIQVGQLAQSYRQQKGTLSGFDNALAQWSESNPLFPGGNTPGGVANGIKWSVVK